MFILIKSRVMIRYPIIILFIMVYDYPERFLLNNYLEKCRNDIIFTPDDDG